MFTRNEDDNIYCSCCYKFRRIYVFSVGGSVAVEDVLHSLHSVFRHYSIVSNPPWGRRGFKSRIRPPYPQRVVKGD